ncbi:MAG TPA: hypothetical protein VGL77_15800, partial [Armatimonadota bacterium]
MRYCRFVVAFLLVVAVAIPVFAWSNAAVDTTQPTGKRIDWLQKDYTNPTPGGATQTAVLPDTVPLTIAKPASTVTYQVQMRVRPVDPTPFAYGGYYGADGNYYPYASGDYSREGFVTEPQNWWIGNQPYLPYYGYNPPTTDGYYPPYAYNTAPVRFRGYNNYNQIVPAPPLVSPPAYIPAFTTPVPPAPLQIEVTPHGIITRRDPHFQLFYVPQPPNYLTTGSAIYQMPQQSFYYGYPP